MSTPDPIIAVSGTSAAAIIASVLPRASLASLRIVSPRLPCHHRPNIAAVCIHRGGKPHRRAYRRKAAKHCSSVKVNGLFGGLARRYPQIMQGLLSDPDRVLALAHVPPHARPAIAALWAMDERLAGIVAATREPALGLMRLVWWRDALEGLETGPPPAEPLLAACADAGLDGRALAATVAGWEALLDDPDIADEAVALHAHARGVGMFALAGALLGAPAADEARLCAAGEGWATADLARLVDRGFGRPARAAELRAAARVRLDEAMARRWPRRLRPLGELAAVARADCAVPPPGPRARALVVLRHQLTGR